MISVIFIILFILAFIGVIICKRDSTVFAILTIMFLIFTVISLNSKKKTKSPIAKPDSSKFRGYIKPDNTYYKLYLFDDSISLYDNDRVVSRFSYDSSDIGRILIKDNE